MKTRIKFVLSVSFLVMISACADPQSQNGDFDDKKPNISAEKEQKSLVLRKKTTTIEKYNDRLLSDKKEQVLSAIDEGLKMIDRELIKESYSD